MCVKIEEKQTETNINIFIISHTFVYIVICHICVEMEELQNVLTSLEGWSGGCPCHGNMFERDKKGRWHRNKAYQRMAGLNGQFDFCPFSGCRAPELATGKLVAHVEELASMATTEVVLTALQGIREDSEGIRDFLMRQWHVGLGVILVGLSEKLTFWSELPHALVGLASFEEPIVRSTAASCISKFAQVDTILHHPLSRLFCDPEQENGFFTELKAVADGATIASCSEVFQLWCQRMRFWTVLETPIEEKHARLNRTTRQATNVSESLYSMRLRVGEIFRNVEENPEYLKSLLTEFEHLNGKGRLHMLQVLGLERHPQVLKCIQDRSLRGEKKQRKIKCKLAKSIVYHADPDSQYLCHADAAALCSRKQSDREKKFKELVDLAVRDHKLQYFEAPKVRIGKADDSKYFSF